MHLLGFRDVVAVTSFVIIIASFSMPSKAEVFISDRIRMQHTNDEISVTAGNIAWTIGLIMKHGDKIEVEANVHNALFDDLTIMVCSDTDLISYQRGLVSGCSGVTRGKKRIAFTFVAEAHGKYHVVLDNRFSAMLTKSAHLQTWLNARISGDEVDKFRRAFSGFTDKIYSTFDVKNFDFRFEPCGMKNAMSMTNGGHIIMCSELVFDYAMKNRKGALGGTLFHELGHSLLNLWGLPGWDNEETVDEFAVVMFHYLGNPEWGEDWIKEFEEHDSAAQAKKTLRTNVRHPLSIQRARNIRRILGNPNPIIDRWNRLLYPHMTTRELEKISAKPGKYGDADAARQQLQYRRR
ncbi:MAG: DUF4344 domain-containing metallopeptidase [Magnetospirillum sp. WYHS-4]